MPLTADIVVLVTNAPDYACAQRLAGLILDSGLGACVSIGAPVQSLYRWQGQLEQREEYPLWIKTTRGAVANAQAAIVAAHPDDVPELLVLPVVDGLGPYMQWVRDAVSGDPASAQTVPTHEG